MKTLVLVTGGFDPLHSGHIAYFRAAKQLGDTLVVGVNSDAWLVRKKGRAFMPWLERMNIVKNIKDVDFVLEFNDDDGSAKSAIKLARQTWPDHKIVFANGGDRTHINIPEMEFEDDNVEFAFGVGGFDKANSSSWILEEWKAPKTNRAITEFYMNRIKKSKLKNSQCCPRPVSACNVTKIEQNTGLCLKAQLQYTQ